jgi:Type VI secretion system/phage-baseplate injector OB domain
MNAQGPPFYGKYRGVVTDDRDPVQLGRVRARVQDVLGDQESGWAMPAVPYAGKGVGFFLIPPVDALVWFEFEHGDPDRPIWTGCLWATGELDGVPEKKVLKTDAGTITLDDTPSAGGITIETAIGMRIKISTQGIEITNGQNGTIQLTGPRYR